MPAFVHPHSDLPRLLSRHIIKPTHLKFIHHLLSLSLTHTYTSLLPQSDGRCIAHSHPLSPSFLSSLPPHHAVPTTFVAKILPVAGWNTTGFALSLPSISASPSVGSSSRALPEALRRFMSLTAATAPRNFRLALNLREGEKRGRGEENKDW